MASHRIRIGLILTASNLLSFTTVTLKYRTKVLVERVEYLDQLPSLWPVPPIPTLFIVDLYDPKYSFDGPNGPLAPDGLIKDKVRIF